MRITDVLIGFFTGIISGFGIGGGSLLVLYLTVFGGVDQYTAGGVNLLYFCGCAPSALISHLKQKRVVFECVLWGLASGIPLSVLTAVFSSKIDTELLHKAFGILLFYIGFKELFTKKTAATDNSETR